MKTWGVIALAVVATTCALAQKKNAGADWPMFNRDLAATRFSPLTQINTKNAVQLKLAWSYKLGKHPSSGSITGGFESTPIAIEGVLYLTTINSVIALDPTNGKELWIFPVTGSQPSKRGVAYWVGDSTNPPRIIFTTGRRMVALNAKTGKIDPGFGKEGEVDLEVPYDSAPVIYKNVLLVGANTGEAPATGQAGDTRGYDARTGAKLWAFHSVPQPGEPGHESWEADSWKERSGVNNWGFSMTVDAQRGIVYTVFGGPNTNYWGGDRHGNNLYGNSVVALDAETGKMKWYFQAVHHDIFDYDLPPAPALVDVTVNGRKIPALAQTTKSGYMYILDRVTGKPVFGVEEKPVGKSLTPGEQSSPTQPIPVKPPALARTSFKADEVVTAADTNEEHAKFCRDLMERSGGLVNEGPFTPYPYKEAGAPARSSILFPGSIGGVNWGGVAVDPRTSYIFVNTMDEASIGWVEKKNQGSVQYDRNSVLGPTSRFQWFEGNPRSGNIVGSGAKAWPCQKPPWGRLIAVNGNTGEFAWSIPFGVTDELPAAKQNTGRLSMGGPIVTASGLLFIGASNDKRFRAFDSKSGKQLWEAKMDMSAHAIPMTFLGKNGKQYVAIVSAGASAIDDPGPEDGQALLVYALP